MMTFGRTAKLGWPRVESDPPGGINVGLRVSLVMAAYRKYASFSGIRKPYLELFCETVRKMAFFAFNKLPCSGRMIQQRLRSISSAPKVVRG